MPALHGSAVDASIVIRTLNEGKWLPKVLESVRRQDVNGYRVETIVVDSGSTDDTLQAARRHGARIVRIAKEEFTFGRSLNVGCDAAEGRNLIFISGHTIPIGDKWLQRLMKPLDEGTASYVYGRQVGHPVSKFSEVQLLKKHFPARSALPQDGFFCNNANAALPKRVWSNTRFDEEITGLEDMELAKRLVEQGHKIGYVADAAIEHIHEESWASVRNRYEREAIALQGIMPEVHVSFGDFLRYLAAGVLLDWSQAISDRVFVQKAGEIVMFRLMQYWGTYRGNNDHRKVSRARKERYFYPR